MKRTLSIAAVALLSAACAHDAEYRAQRKVDDKQVVTGSHVPKKYWPQEVTVVDRDALDRTQTTQGGGDSGAPALPRGRGN